MQLKYHSKEENELEKNAEIVANSPNLVDNGNLYIQEFQKFPNVKIAVNIKPRCSESNHHGPSVEIIEAGRQWDFFKEWKGKKQKQTNK